MGMLVCAGAALKCAFGAAPSALAVIPGKQFAGGLPPAVITDNKPLVNIMPFGMCSSPANPAVAAATAAALGALTPMPCIPVIPAPWAAGSPTCLIGGVPALNDSSGLMCAYGGMISISSAGQTTVNVP